MRKKKKWLVGMLVIVNVFLLFGCGKRQETRDDKVHIGVTYYNQSDTFLNELLARSVVPNINVAFALVDVFLNQSVQSAVTAGRVNNDLF